MRIIVLGGGIAGLKVAEALNATLITKRQCFVFQPSLTDTINLKEDNIVKPIKHSSTVFAKAKRIDTKRKLVDLGQKTMPYDVLIIATGAKPRLTIPGSKTYALPFYSLEDARKLKGLMPKGRTVIIGGGATGIELAMELAPHTKVTVLHSDSEILAGFTRRARLLAEKHLRRADVQVLTGRRVDRITSKAVHTTTDDYPYDLVVLAAGVQANVPEGLPKEHGILVDEHLRVQGLKDVFACGDCAQTGSPLTAQAAQQEADAVIKNVLRLKAKKPLEPFHYDEKGRMLGLARKGVLTVPPVTFNGRFAGLVRELYYRWQFGRY